LARIRRGDGEADVQRMPAPRETLTGSMFNRVSGDAFDVIVAVAEAADLTILPEGCQ
jgi:hypothetical protein